MTSREGWHEYVLIWIWWKWTFLSDPTQYSISLGINSKVQSRVLHFWHQYYSPNTTFSMQTVPSSAFTTPKLGSLLTDGFKEGLLKFPHLINPSLKTLFGPFFWAVWSMDFLWQGIPQIYEINEYIDTQLETFNPGPQHGARVTGRSRSFQLYK